MKKQTPMEMRKHAKPAEKKASAKGSMDSYAKQRAAKPAPKAAMVTSISDMPMHDPESDLHYLTRAEEVKANPHRHKAAKAVAKKRIAALSNVSKD